MSEQMVLLNDQEVDLFDLANFAMDEIAEARFEALPVGRYRVICEKVESSTADIEDKTLNRKVTRAVREWTFVVEEVVRLANPKAADVEKLIGRKLKHRVTIFTIDSIGTVKAFVNDCVGADNTVGLNFGELCEKPVGQRMEIEIQHRPNKDNPQRPYVQINTDAGKIRPI